MNGRDGASSFSGRPARILATAAAIALGALLGIGASDAGAQEASPTHASIVYDARVIEAQGETQLEIDMTADVEVKAFVMAEPHRLVIDLPEVGFALRPDVHGEGAGLVSAYRYGLLGPGRSRIVADLTGPAEISAEDISDTDYGRRLAFTLRPAPLERVLTRVSSLPFAALADASPTSAARKSDRVESAIGLPGMSVPTDGPIVVVIDPGHGGIDSGAVSRSGTPEKDLVLEFANVLKKAIARDARFEAILTRDDDRFLSLSERVAFARDAGARLFISVHADAVRQTYVRGATVYTLSERASDARAAALASKENRADLVAGLAMDEEDKDVADILIDLARRETKNFSVLAARTLVNELRGATPLNKNPIRSAQFRVLRAPDVPSVLLELGYLSNEKDAASFEDHAWREKTAERIAGAVASYFARPGMVTQASPAGR